MTKTAIVTGASRGIGKAIAKELFSGLRYNVILLSRNPNEINAVSEEIKANCKGRFYDCDCIPYNCDISNKDNVRETFSKVYCDFGSIDVLVNNAGINSRKTFPKSRNLDDWVKNFDDNLRGFDEEVAINLRGTFICSYLASAYMLSGIGGSIINISSVKGREPTTSPGYGASKSGIIKLTKDFAKALAPDIRVNCIAPGFIDTGMTSELPEDKKEDYKKMIPFKRFGSVEEIARVARFLASQDSAYITGASIDVNGGYLMR